MDLPCSAARLDMGTGIGRIQHEVAKVSENRCWIVAPCHDQVPCLNRRLSGLWRCSSTVSPRLAT
jgi:hypothetical protein